MKSKMKSAFAIIAVALMIMVAVVPMVGVFTSESDAALIPDINSSSDPTVGTIIISGMVYDINGSGIAKAKAYYAMATWGDGKYTKLSSDVIGKAQGAQTSDTDGYYSISIPDNKITGVTVTVVKYDSVLKKYVQIEEFGKVELGTLVSSAGTTENYVANFKSGTTTEELTKAIKFPEVPGNLTNSLVTFFGATATITVSYTLYSDEEGDTEIAEGQSILSSNKISITYPGTYTDIWMEITGVSAIVDNVKYDKALKSDIYKVKTSGNDSLSDIVLNQVPISFTMSGDVPDGTLTGIKTYYTDGSDYKEYATSATPFKTNEIKSGAPTYFFVNKNMTEGESPTLRVMTAMSATVNFGTMTQTLTTVAVSSSKDAWTYSPTGFYGTFMMGTVDAYDGQNLGLAVKYEATVKEGAPEGTTPATGTASLTAYVADGKYVAVYAGYTPDANHNAATYKVKPTSTGFEVSAIANCSAFDEDGYATVTSFGGNGVTIKSDKYALVSGTVKLSDGATYLPVGYSISLKSATSTVLAASDVFGYKLNSGVATIPVYNDGTNDGCYKIYVLKDKEIVFSAASGEKFTLVDEKKTLIVGNVTIPLVVAPKYMYFMFTDGDGAAIPATDGDKSYAPAVTIKDYAVGKDVKKGTITNVNVDPSIATPTPGFYMLPIYSTFIDLEDMKVSFAVTSTGTGALSYTFQYTGTTYTNYSADKTTGYMTVASLDTTYNVRAYDANGNVIIAKENNVIVSPFTFSTVSVYKAESGSLIFGPATGITTGVSVDQNGLVTIRTLSKYINQTIDENVKTIVELTPINAVATTYVLDDYYILNPDKTSGILTITADADKITGQVVKRDGTTGIAKVTVSLKATADSDVIATAVTDKDGNFTIKTPTAIAHTYVLAMAPNTGDKSTFEASYPLYDSEDVQYTKFKSLTDSYSITLTDADGRVVTLVDGNRLNIAGIDIDVSSKSIKDDLALDVGTVVTPTYYKKNTDANNAVTYTVERTFAPYTVKADDIKTGKIALTTLYSTYTVELTDSEGVNPLSAGPIATPSVFVYENGKKTTTQYGLTYDGVYTYEFSVALPALQKDNTEYKVTVANIDDYVYKFSSSSATAFTDNAATVKSLYTKIYFGIEDAAGATLSISGLSTNDPAVKDYFGEDTDTVEQQKVVTTRPVTLAPGANTAFFYGNKSLTYVPTVEWTVSTDYKVSTESMLVGGVFTTLQEKVVFKATDAVGKSVSLVGVDKAILSIINADGTVQETTYTCPVDSEGSFYAIIVADPLYTYGLQTYDDEETDVYYFTYENIADNVFVANESILTPAFVTPNGFEAVPIPLQNVDLVQAFGVDGTVISKYTENLLVVDTDNVAYYKVNQGAGAIYTFENQELLPLFVANESLVMGSLPFSGNVDPDDQRLEVLLCLGDNVVDMYVAYGDDDDGILYFDDDGYSYGLIIDLSNYITDVGAIVFDSIIANYYENNILVATGAIDPFTAINNIYTPEQQAAARYNVIDQTSGPGALYSQAYVVNNNLLVLSATPVFYISDEGYYVDGQYKYVFAGWFVDGVKVSANADFAMNIEADVVVAAQYDVTYEKISDANKDVEKEYVNVIQEVPVEKESGLNTNVLIIGICAVIVALIAVVYAVIKKE